MKSSKKQNKFRRLFFDIETSPNVALTWNIGQKISLSHDNIIKERAIICICWKWDDENKVNYLTWNNGDDSKLVKEFSKIINSADEILGHNSDSYDIKWLRTRCLYHGVPLIPDYQTVDTLKLSRKGFRFNSNRLDYIGQFLGVGRKMETGGFSLWKDVVLRNDKKALAKMVDYCKKDVLLLESVYNRLSPYVVTTHNKAIAEGKEINCCPHCSSEHVISNGIRISASGIKKRRLHCQDCGKYFTIANSVFEKIKDKFNGKRK